MLCKTERGEELILNKPHTTPLPTKENKAYRAETVKRDKLAKLA
jgi:hypothetical protein